MIKPGAREMEALRLIAQGLRYKEIAKKMSISPKTVSSHIYRCKIKMGAKTLPNAIFIACQNNYFINL